MNLVTSLLYGYGTHEGLLKAWDTRGRLPGGEVAEQHHNEADFLSTAPGSRNNPIDVGDDVKRAVKLIAQGKHVKLNQPSEVATLVGKIKKDAQLFHDEGKPIPDYNLADISVQGKNLFAVDNVGIPRVDMPQLAGWVDPGSPAAALLPKGAGPKAEVDLAPQFIKELKDSGINVTEDKVQASRLRATQEQLDGSKVAGIVSALESGKLAPGEIFITKDNYILDGHHRWAANIIEDAKNNRFGDVMMPVHRLDTDIGTALTKALDFQHRWGISKARVSGGKKEEWLPGQEAAAVLASIFMDFGGQGSGCRGDNCGRPVQYGALKMPRGRQSMKRINSELRAAAKEKKLVLIEYEKEDEDRAKSYLVEPYSYRNEGKMLFGFDQTAKSIKAFKMDKIVRVSPLGKKFKPRWPVELAARANAGEGYDSEKGTSSL